MNVTTVSELLQTISVSELKRFDKYIHGKLLNEYFLIVPDKTKASNGENKLVSEVNLFKYLYENIFKNLVSFIGDTNKIEFSTDVYDHNVFLELYKILNDQPCDTPNDLYNILVSRNPNENLDQQDPNSKTSLNLADYFCKKYQYYCFGNSNSELHTLRLTYGKDIINNKIPLKIQTKEVPEYEVYLPNRMKIEKANSSGLSKYVKYYAVDENDTGIIDDIQWTIDTIRKWVENSTGVSAIRNLKEGYVMVSTASKDLIESTYIAPNGKSFKGNSEYKLDLDLANGRFIYASGKIQMLRNGIPQDIPVTSQNYKLSMNENVEDLAKVALETILKHSHGDVMSIALMQPQVGIVDSSKSYLQRLISHTIGNGNYTGLFQSTRPITTNLDETKLSTVSLPSDASPLYDAESTKDIDKQSNELEHENLPPYYTAKIIVVTKK